MNDILFEKIKDVVQEIGGWTAAILTLYLFIPPLYPYINLLKGKINYEETPGAYVFIHYINYVCWYSLGELLFIDQLKITYFIGSITFLSLMLIYLYYEMKYYIIDSILNLLIIITGTFCLYVGFTIILDDDKFTSKFCLWSSLVSYFFDIQTIYKVYKYKNYTLINMTTTIINFIASLGWIDYGYFVYEYYIMYPHIINCFIQFITIIVYFIFKRIYSNSSEKYIPTLGIEVNNNTVNGNINDEEMEKIKARPVKIEDKKNSS